MHNDNSAVPPPPSVSADPSARLASVDAFRGLAMLMMSSEGLHIGHAAGFFPQSAAWQAAAFHTDHVEWRGWALWDLIQPSFMFLVGVAMAFSYVKRARLGETYWRSFGHAFTRALVLVFLGIFLRSMSHEQTYFTFEDVLTQIGLGYVFLYLLWNRPLWVQGAAAAAILVGTYVAFEAYPLPPEGFNYSEVGVSNEWFREHGFVGKLAHWNKNSNLAADFDVWFLNLFPRENYFRFNGGGYQTLNFVPALGTMVLGLMAGTILRRWQDRADKLVALTSFGIALIALGWWLDASDVCPLVKRIWTPTWAVWSAGTAMCTLAAFYLLVDIVGCKWFAWPLQVVGANSIVVYVLAWIAYPFFHHNIAIHIGNEWTRDLAVLLGGGVASAAEAIGPVVENAAILFCFWLICLWLWKQKVFIRI